MDFKSSELTGYISRNIVDRLDGYHSVDFSALIQATLWMSAKSAAVFCTRSVHQHAESR
jgi:fructose-1,6-bisphosphatase